MRFPSRKAICPGCGKKITAYVPTAHCPSTDGPQTYIFRAHKIAGAGSADCEWWALSVPNDAFVDGKPNLAAT